MMVKYGSNYDTGRIGAEITYTIMRDKFGLQNLVVREPARRGVDLYTVDGLTVVESRLFTKVEPECLKGQIVRDICR